MVALKTIYGKPFHVDKSLLPRLRALDEDIKSRWEDKRLNLEIQRNLFYGSKIEAVYHSNLIEGNRLTYSQTLQVIQENQVIAGKPARDQRETSNLWAAIEFAWETAYDPSKPITQNFLRQFHGILLHGIQDDAGQYRDTPIKITGSEQDPPKAFLVPSLMENLSDFLKQATSQTANRIDSPVFSAAAAHALFGQIHPFTDGNGRTARHAIMDTILIRRGYAPCIITDYDKPRYIDALEEAWGSADEDGDLTALTELMRDIIEAQLQFPGWLASLRNALESVETKHIRQEYDDFLINIEYLRAHFVHNVHVLNASNSPIHGKVIRYPLPTIQKYAAVRDGIMVRQRRHFGLEFRGMGNNSRYMFFFITPSDAMADRTPVALNLMKDTDYGYTGLSSLYCRGLAAPNIFQIGYDIKKRRFIASGTAGIRERNPQKLAEGFVKQVVQRDFTT